MSLVEAPRTYGSIQRPLPGKPQPKPDPTQASLDRAEDVARGNYLRAVFRSAWQMREGVTHERMRITSEHLECLADEFMAAKEAAKRKLESSPCVGQCENGEE